MNRPPFWLFHGENRHDLGACMRCTQNSALVVAESAPNLDLLDGRVASGFDIEMALQAIVPKPTDNDYASRTMCRACGTARASYLFHCENSDARR